MSCIAQLISGQDDSHGSEFFIGVYKNSYNFLTTVDLHIATTSSSAVTFNIADVDGVIDTGTVTLNDPTTYSLNTKYVVSDSSYSYRDKGLRVYTDNGGLIQVIVVHHAPASVGDHVVYPYEELTVPEYVYHTVSTDTDGEGFAYLDFHSLTLLVGTADDTTVTITPSHAIVVPGNIQISNSADITVPAGDSYTITLHRLQTFLFEDSEVDLTGTKIVSNKPLSVTSGHQCSNVPEGKNYCEATSVNVPPTATWGTQFLLTPHAGRTGGQYYKMVASQSSTTITHNCNIAVTTTTLAKEGDFLFLLTTSVTYCYVESSKPVFIVILGIAGTLSGQVGDPVMAMIPPINDYTYEDILFYIPSYIGFTSHHINIMSTVSNPTVNMNGKTLSLTWNTINDNDGVAVGYAAQLALDQSDLDEDHMITTDDDVPITVLVYGWGKYRGLCYTVGVKLANLGRYIHMIVLDNQILIWQYTVCVNVYRLSECMRHHNININAHVVYLIWYDNTISFLILIQY